MTVLIVLYYFVNVKVSAVNLNTMAISPPKDTHKKKNPTKTKISARARDLKVPGRLNSAVLLQLTAGYELKLENLPPRFHTSELQLLDSSRLWSGMKRTTDQVTDSSLDDALCLSLSHRSARFPWIDNSSWVGPHSQHFLDRTGWLTD